MSGKRKPDYSNYLAHFTRDSVCVNNGNCLDEDYILMSALEKLISILKTKTIKISLSPEPGIFISPHIYAAIMPAIATI